LLDTGDGRGDFLEWRYRVYTGFDILDAEGDFIDDDNDGIPDAWEGAHGLDAEDPNDAGADWDGEGLSNYQEFLHFGDPHDCDTDSDGMDDFWEVRYGLNVMVDDAEDDNDQDG